MLVVETDNNEITQLIRGILSQIPLKEGDPHYDFWWKLSFALSGIKIIVQNIMDTAGGDEANFIESVSSLSFSIDGVTPFLSSPHLGSFFVNSGIIELLCSKVCLILLLSFLLLMIFTADHAHCCNENSKFACFAMYNCK